MLEKGRAAMQTQFDSWYNQLLSRGGNVAVPLVTAAGAEKSAVETLSATRTLPNVPLPEPEEDVNEDIAAFYKAKDALLKRREETK